MIAAHHDDIHEGRVGAVMSDTMIRATVATAIEGRVLDQPAEESRTWVYDYRWPGRQGAAHCADLPIWFGTLGAKTANNVVGPVTTTDPSDPTAAVLMMPPGKLPQISCIVRYSTSLPTVTRDGPPITRRRVSAWCGMRNPMWKWTAIGLPGVRGDLVRGMPLEELASL